ncbi:Thioredoxin domain-containing protein 17, partial [Schistosoma japonicum]
LSTSIRNIDELLAEVKKHEGKRIFILFCGTPFPDGTNWCPDCFNSAVIPTSTRIQNFLSFLWLILREPIVKEALKKLPENAVFLKAEVGDRTTWRDPNNVFRTHPKCQISSIPSLIEFNTVSVFTMRRLSDKEVLQPSLVELMFED